RPVRGRNFRGGGGWGTRDGSRGGREGALADQGGPVAPAGGSAGGGLLDAGELRDELRAGPHAESPVDAGEPDLDGAQRDEDALRDLAVAPAFAHEVDRPSLLVAQLGEEGVLGARGTSGGNVAHGKRRERAQPHIIPGA